MPPIPLRDGSFTQDPRLTWIPFFDPESLKYAVKDLFDKDKPLATKYWKCDKVLNQGMEGACFPPGTMVRMADGSHKGIEDVHLLDEVVTAEGYVGRVRQTIVRPYDGNLFNVKLRGHPPVLATGNHPFLTKRGYVAAQDLRADDYVAVTRFVAGAGRAVLALEQMHLPPFRGRLGRVNTGGVESVVTPSPTSIQLSPGMGRIVGLYAAEGHTTRHKVVWSFGGHEEGTLVAELVGLLHEELQIEARKQRRPNGSINVVAYGKLWMELFSLLVPGTRKRGDKRLSPFITSGGREFLSGVLTGWLDGDGHRRRSCTEGVTVSKQLALDMHAIANDLGMRPVLSTRQPVYNRSAKTRQPSWSVTISEGGGLNVMEQDEAAVWRKVMSNETSFYRGWVFNLHVEGAESYVADGLGVHNCTGYAVAHELIATPVVVQGIDNEFAKKKIYWEAQKIDSWPGGSYPGASPYMEGSSVLAAMKVVAKIGYVTEYRWAFGIEDVKTALSQIGPVVLGIPWYDGMMKPAPCGYLHPIGEKVGGHAILALGIDVPKQRILLHNSWGKAWASDGRAWVHWDDLAFCLRGLKGEACVPLKRHATPNP